MTSAELDPAGLLQALSGMPAAGRAEYLRSIGPPDELFAALAAECEQLVYSEVARALEAGELLQELADAMADEPARARVLRARGQVLAYAGRHKEALECFQQAAELSNHHGDPLSAAHARMTSIHPLASLGRYDEAMQAGETAREAFLAAGEEVLAARADLNLGATNQMRGDAAAAVRHLKRASPHFHDDPVTLAKLNSNLGHALMGLDDFVAAEEAYQAALPTFEAESLNWAAAIVAGNLAELFTRQGRLQRAFYHFELARRHMERDEAPHVLARLTAEQAEAHAMLGLLDDAGSGYEQAAPQLDEHGLAQEAARARAGLGAVYLRQGRHAEADSVLDAAAASFGKLGHRVAQARVELVRAELARESGDLARARALIEAARPVLADRVVDAALIHYQRSRLASLDGDREEALREICSAIEGAEKLDLAPLLADLLHVRAGLRSASGDWTAAAEDLRRAVAHVERVRGTLQAERFRAAFLGNRLDMYEDMVTAVLASARPGSQAEAFDVVERAKSRSLLDLLGGSVDAGAGSEAADGDDAEREMAAEWSRTRAELNALYSRLADAETGFGDQVAVQDRRAEIRARETALERLGSRLATTRGVAELYAPTIDLAAAQRLCGAETAVIEYFIAGDELLAFVVRESSVRIHRRLADAEGLSALVRRVHFQIRRAMRPGVTEGTRGARLLEDVRRELGALYDCILRPLEESTGSASRLVIVPHGALHTVPFAALWDGRRYLAERTATVTAPSASVLAHARARAGQESGHGALVVGVPDERAPQIEHEARTIARTLNCRDPLLGADASLERVVQKAADADIIHLACHGYFSADNPMASGLKLADRWLTVREVYQLRLRASLVTLSGCETGRNVVATGEELVGLVRGFLAAGASALVVSLWTVNDESTASLMQRFYEFREESRYNGSEALALQAAQIATLAQRPHPVFWAPFTVVGEA